VITVENQIYEHFNIQVKFNSLSGPNVLDLAKISNYVIVDLTNRQVQVS